MSTIVDKGGGEGLERPKKYSRGLRTTPKGQFGTRPMRNSSYSVSVQHIKIMITDYSFTVGLGQICLVQDRLSPVSYVSFCLSLRMFVFFHLMISLAGVRVVVRVAFGFGR